jgi:hypothetical protein
VSHDATAWAKVQKTGSTSAKFILVLLADYAGTDYSCYPSVAKLAEIAEMGESTVRAATKLLAERGLIRVFYRHRQSGLRRSCRYQLLIDGPDTAEPDAEDWANYRPISADGNRQDSADDAPDLSASVRQISADIPSKDPSLLDPPVVIPGASQPKTATRVPDDFQPTEEMRAWFVGEGLPGVIDGKIEHEKFMDYWRACPGAKGRKLDWAATWRNWMRTAAERAPRRPGTALAPTSGAPRYYPSTTDAKVAQTLAMGAMFEEEDAR